MDDQRYQELLKYLKTGKGLTDKEDREWAEQFKEIHDHVYKEERRVIPRSEVTWIISMFHDDPTMAYQSAETIYQHISKRYIWETMRRDIREYTRTCYECQMRGTPKRNNPKVSIPPKDIFERWGIDIVGPLPLSSQRNKYIIVAVDYFTRWPEAKAVKTANAITVADFIYDEIICRFGAPKIIQSDQGTHFVNEVIRQLTEKFRIRHKLSSPYHPQSNGLVERFNKTLCEGLAKVAETIQDWDSYIQPAHMLNTVFPSTHPSASVKSEEMTGCTSTITSSKASASQPVRVCTETKYVPDTASVVGEISSDINPDGPDH
jgi:transposase InsO family protein